MDDLSDAIAMAETGTYVVSRTPPPVFVNGLAVDPELAAQWVTGTVYPPGAMASNEGGVFQTAAGGIAGPTAPTGTVAGVSDGTVLWDWIAPALTTFQATGSLQPVSGRELDRLAELYRAKEARVFFTETRLISLDDDGGPDVVRVGSKDFQVANVQDWQILGNFFRATLIYVGR